LVSASVVVLAVLVVLGLLGAPLSAMMLGRSSLLFAWTEGARATLVAGTLVMLASFAFGIGAGAAAALGPRIVDVLLTRIVELGAALPAFAVVVVVRALRPMDELWTIALVLAVLRGLSTAKLVRGALVQLETEEFVLAARALGTTRTRLFRAHLLRHVEAPALSEAAHAAAAVVGLDAALNLAGLGSGGPSFGALLAEAVELGSPATAFVPALGTAATLAAFLVLADAVEDDVRVGRRFV
jgi:ABC-type dipeptide/oligopeptide/nickel transport system permease subunit